MPPLSRSPGKRRKYFILIIIAVLGWAGYRYGMPMLMGGGPAMGGFAMPVEMVTVAARPLEDQLESVGTLAANESATIRPEVAGRVKEILFTEGQPAKKGDRLFQIDDRISQAELKQASANLQLATLNYERFRKLSRTGASTKQRFDEAQANLGVAQANFDLAKTRVDYANITAPFDGVVGLRSVSPGDYVNVGQPLANFVSYDPMKVDFSIPETQSGVLQVGQPLDMTVEALPGETFRGAVYALDPQLDVNGRSVSLRATIPNSDYRLKPGFFARVALTVGHKEAAIVVPESAVVPQGDAKLIYVVGADDAVALTPVTLGQRMSGEVEVLSGLNVGDRVVTSGQIKLHPGAKVMDIKLMQQQQEGGKPPAGAGDAK